MEIRRQLHLRDSRVVKGIMNVTHATEILVQTRCSVKVSLLPAPLPYSVLPMLRLHPISFLGFIHMLGLQLEGRLIIPVRPKPFPQGQRARDRHGKGLTLNSRRQNSSPGPFEAQK